MLATSLTPRVDSQSRTSPGPLGAVRQCLDWDQTGFVRYPLFRWGVLGLLQLLYSAQARERWP